MNLHLIQKSPFSSSALQECLKTISDQDSLLLMQDGVFATQQNLHTDNAIYALKSDCEARGLATNNSSARNIHYITMDEFVTLCTQHKQTISWF